MTAFWANLDSNLNHHGADFNEEVGVEEFGWKKIKVGGS